MSIAFIGAGNMAEALISGILSSSGEKIGIVDIDTARCQFMREKYAVEVFATAENAANNCDNILLAIKPQQAREVLQKLKASISTQHLLLSIMAGISTSKINELLGEKGRLIRIMPNTPALVKTGFAAICAGPRAQQNDINYATSLMNSVGEVIQLEEAFMDAVTAISGSGPGYLFYFMEAMQETATTLGFTADQARKMIIRTFAGATALAEKTDGSFASLRQKVTSPGGTTEAALQIFDQRELKQVIQEALLAAHNRAKELSES